MARVLHTIKCILRILTKQHAISTNPAHKTTRAKDLSDQTTYIIK